MPAGVAMPARRELPALSPSAIPSRPRPPVTHHAAASSVAPQDRPRSTPSCSAASFWFHARCNDARPNYACLPSTSPEAKTSVRSPRRHVPSSTHAGS